MSTIQLVLWDFVSDNDGSLCVVSSLLRESLRKKPFQYKFDPATKHSALLIEDDGLTVTKVGEQYCSAVFTTGPLTQSTEISFQCLNFVNWVAFGAADRDNLINTVIPNGLQGAHAYLISTAGFVWCPNNPKYHNTSSDEIRVDNTGKILTKMRYDSKNNTLTFQSGAQILVMNDIPTGLYPMIMLYMAGDSARIVERGDSARILK
jgi:hypothetical protein